MKWDVYLLKNGVTRTQMSSQEGHNTKGKSFEIWRNSDIWKQQ